MDKWNRLTMAVSTRKRNSTPVATKTGEDGDFVQLRKVREKHNIEKTSKPQPLRESILTRTDKRKDDDTIGKPITSGSVKRVKQLDDIRDSLFKAVEDNDKSKTMTLLAQIKQMESLTSPLVCHPDTNENIWHFALSNDKKDIASLLLDREDEALTMSYHEIVRTGIHGKRNALHICIEKNNIEMAKQILTRINTQRKRLDMMSTETAIDIQGQRPRLLSCLHLAAYYGYLDLVGLFITQGMDVNHLNGKKDTALLWAARWGHSKVVANLLNRGADPEMKNDKGSTALYWAVRYEHVETVDVLLKKGNVNPNTTRKLGLVAPLIVASAYGNYKIVKLLLSHPECDVNIRIRGGEIPIHHAAREGHDAVLQILLDNGALLDDKDELGDTPLLLAAQNNHVDLVYKLINLGANVFHRNHEGNDIWTYAVDGEDNVLLDTLLLACMDKKLDITSRQPLCIAASHGRNDKIEFLLQVKQGLLGSDSEGNTFLHHAALNDKYDVIEQFHSIISIDSQNNSGNTPLHVACMKGFHKTIKILLKCKAKSNKMNNEGETPLHVAALSRCISAEAVRELVNYTMVNHSWESLNAKDYKGNNCLHIAGKFAKPDVLWEFRFVRFKDRDNDGLTPLHEAVRPGQPESLHKMLDIFETMKRDARINEQSYDRNETVLHLAAEEGLSTCVKRMIDLGADLGVKDVDGNTVLHRLTIATVLQPKHLKQHMEVFETVFDRVVKWWCIKESIAYPEEDNQAEYMLMRKEASLFLTNDIYNIDGLSVLGLSFKLGAADIISRLLMMKGVTMFDDESLKTDLCTFDVSHLTPQTTKVMKMCCGTSNAYMPDSKTPLVKGHENNGNTTEDLSALEWLLTQKVKSRTAQILDLPPVKIIEEYYTSIVAKTFALLMVLHIIYMSVFTHVALDLLAKLRDDESAISASDTATLLLYIMVPLEPVIILIYVFYSFLRFVISGDIKRKSKLSGKQGISRILSVISNYTLLLVGVVYAALIIIWIVLFSVRYTFQDYVLAPALCTGWLLSISFTRGFKAIHYFYRMLLSMILRDVVRFMIVYLFVLLAFGFAFHILFQASSAVASDYATPADTLFLSFNMMIGMGELFDDSLETNMATAGRTILYLKIVYLIYIILGTVILLNLLIAMMNDSYSNILEEQQVTWRTESVGLGVAIESSIPIIRVFSKVNFYQGQKSSSTPSSDRSQSTRKRWYVDIDCATVDEYTREQDTMNETTEDELGERLVELEKKTVITNNKLQQLTDLVERMTSH